MNGRTELGTASTADEMREILKGPFGLTLPEAPELEAALKRLTAS